MDNNELNNNLGNEIMMGNTEPLPNINQNVQPNTVNMNQGINTVIQNNLNTNGNVSTQTSQTDSINTIFSDFQSIPNEPVAPSNIQQPEATIPTSVPTQKEKKNKSSSFIIILLILIILGLLGYIVYDKFFVRESLPTSNTTSINKTTEEKENNKVLLKDESKEIVYSLIDEKHEGVIRRIPYVNIDSKYAEEINSELDNLTKKGYLDGQAENLYLQYPVDYKYYVSDEIVSIKFSWATEGEMTFSKIYNINKYTGEKVSNSEILKKVNISDKELNTKMVESYKTARPLESIEDNTNSVVKECYQKDIDTLSSGKIKAMYLSDNELCVLFDLNYIAGAGMGEAILNVSSNKLIKNPVTLE